MKKIFNFFISSFILVFALLFFGSLDVNASGDFTILDSNGDEVITNYDYGDVVYDDIYYETFTLVNNTAENYNFLDLFGYYDFTKISIRFTNNNTILPANGSITFTIGLLAEKDNLVGTLNDTITFRYMDSSYATSDFSLNILSNIVPKIVTKPSIDASAQYVYLGVNQGVPIERNTFQSVFMQISGENNMINAGDYTVTIGFKDKYKDSFRWDTGGNDSFTLNWSIARVTETLVGNSYSSLTNSLLSSIALPTGWSWDNPNTVITSGTNNYTASYTPTDLANYNVVNSEAVPVIGATEYTVSLPKDVNTTSNFSSDFSMLDTETKDVNLTAAVGYMFTSIKLNGVEQISSDVASYTINLNNISSDVVIETVTEKISENTSVNTINNPNTGDNIFIYFISLLVASILLISINLVKRKINN